MDSSRRTVPGYVVVALLGFVVGYFVGREHLKYEMRTALWSAAYEIQKGLASAFGVKPDTDRGKSQEQAQESKPKENAPLPKRKEPDPLSVTLTAKGFRGQDFTNGIYRDAITFSVSFTNLTAKNIRAFDGVLTFTDMLDNTVLSSRLAINNPVDAGATLDWKGELEYNPFTHDHQTLRSEEQSNLKLIFRPGKVLFADGTTKQYE